MTTGILRCILELLYDEFSTWPIQIIRNIVKTTPGTRLFITLNKNVSWMRKKLIISDICGLVMCLSLVMWHVWRLWWWRPREDEFLEVLWRQIWKSLIYYSSNKRYVDYGITTIINDFIMSNKTHELTYHY